MKQNFNKLIEKIENANSQELLVLGESQSQTYDLASSQEQEEASQQTSETGSQDLLAAASQCTEVIDDNLTSTEEIVENEEDESELKHGKKRKADQIVDALNKRPTITEIEFNKIRGTNEDVYKLFQATLNHPGLNTVLFKLYQNMGNECSQKYPHRAQISYPEEVERFLKANPGVSKFFDFDYVHEQSVLQHSQNNDDQAETVASTQNVELEQVIATEETEESIDNKCANTTRPTF